MTDSAAVIMTIEFLALMVIMAGMIFSLDRKQSELPDRMDGRIDDLREEMRDCARSLREGMQGMQRDIRVLSSKVKKAGRKSR